MDERPAVENNERHQVQVYQVPETSQQSESAIHREGAIDPKRRGRRRIWLFVFPLLAWLACLSLAVYSVLPLFPTGQPRIIPVTGADPTQTPDRPTQAPSPAGKDTEKDPLSYVEVAKQRIEICAESFRNYFMLEELAIDNPAIFQNETWRKDVLSAMEKFSADCQELGTLPAAPPAYAEVEHWLKMAASEVEPATTSFSNALEKEQVGEFHLSIRHMLNFVDYIHNAEGAMNGMMERKDI